ncbi:hypothetical protein CCHR01_00782 [Colletotrichum chrysophilum]|uniref:Uncharacterized protein n=1 Tax=Colletotrichum chrysophilum TaxID=1836956 RepID=A0AAD9AYW8_9PEZI|nr:hypothetical protein CCHR01_00782 [Colletotrichum chrysophilum]
MFSTASSGTHGGNSRADQFDEIIAKGRFSIPGGFSFFSSYYKPPLIGHQFRCAVSAPQDTEDSKYWPVSICSVVGGLMSQKQNYSQLPDLNSTVLPYRSFSTSAFLVFNTTGSIDEWQTYIKAQGDISDDDNLIWDSVATSNWKTSNNGAWVDWSPRAGLFSGKVSISTCFTNMPGFHGKVRISSSHEGSEPTLSRDRDTGRYETASIRDQYLNLGTNATSPDLRGILNLHPNSSWEFLSYLRTASVREKWMAFNAVAGSMPWATATFEILPSGFLLPGAFYPYAVHYAHAELFQAIVQHTDSLAQGLQGLFTVLRQMAYYESLPYFDKKSAAVRALSSQALIPTGWTGFSIVALMIVAHFILLTITTVLFLGWTKASWLGNVWASLSQVVSSETQNLISRSTGMDDNAVEKIITRGLPGGNGKSTYRLRVKANELNGRNELSLI